MGMDGRGRWYRWSKKSTVDDYLNLDMMSLSKEIDFTQSCFASITWTRKTRAGGRQPSLGIEVLPGRGIQLHDSHNGEPVEPYTVPIVTTTPHFGGRRYWFRCPNRRCNRRVRILYGGNYFLCRHCHDLTYPVCQQSHADAFETSIGNRMTRIRRELSADGNEHNSVPEKPPRMHWTTYARLAGEYYELHELLELTRIQGFVAKVGHDPTGMLLDYPVRRDWKEHKRRRREDPGYFRERFMRETDCEVEEEDAQWAEPSRLTLGELAKLAEVPYEFAKEAVREELLRPDQGRTTRRKRYRRRLSNWLGKLHKLRMAGMAWEDVRDWTARRWQPGHESERLWPDGIVPDSTIGETVA